MWLFLETEKDILEDGGKISRLLKDEAGRWLLSCREIGLKTSVASEVSGCDCS